jgi:pimeloyl-ACP methyl ester carboxylesterase
MVTAVSLVLVYVVVVAAYVACAVTAVAHGAATGVFFVGAVLMAASVPLAVATIFFALAWIFGDRRAPQRRISLAASLRLYVVEAQALASSNLRMAFGWWTMRDPAPRPTADPVLLLHGVLCNAGVWRAFLRRLTARGIGPVYTLSYGPPQASIELFAEQVATKIDAIREATGAAKVALVTHSMGGVVARAYLRRHGDASVRCLVMVGAPHHGSVHAWLFPGICLRQIRPRSVWLAELNRSEKAASPLRTVSIWSWHDSMVAPQTSARLAGAQNIEIAGVGHNALLGDAEVFAHVVAEIHPTNVSPA